MNYGQKTQVTMSSLAAIQIPKPADEQAFERASVVLWRNLLGDPNVQRNGRRGQRQDGVDLYGVRNGDPSHLVGIQCKLKGPNQRLSTQEIEQEFRKALGFQPDLAEYFITTTAPDDREHHELARRLSAELKSTGRKMVFFVWGWNTLEERIQEHPEAHRTFDPTHSAYAAQILVQTSKVFEGQETFAAETRSNFGDVFTGLNKIQSLLPSLNEEAGAHGVDRHLNAEIDGYRDLIGKGKPVTALGFLDQLWQRVGNTASGVIRFRIKANIAICHHALGKNDEAATLMFEACQYAPTDKRAIANKVFALNLKEQWNDAVDFGKEALADDPTNEWVANHLIQAARHIPAIKSALDLVPLELHTSKSVLLANAIFLRSREETPAWWQAARAAASAAPEVSLCRQFAAEAELDEIGRDFRSHLDRGLTDSQRRRLVAVVRVLSDEWDKNLAAEGSAASADLSLASNLINCHRLMGAYSEAVDVARKGLATKVNDSSFFVYATLAALEGRDDELAAQLVPRLSDAPEAAMLRFQYYVQRGRWSEVAVLGHDFASLVPLEERSLVATGLELAEIRQQSPSVAQEMLETLIERVASDPRSSALAAQIAKDLGYTNAFEVAFSNAVTALNFRSLGAARHMVGMYAFRIQRWGEAADVLDGRIAEDVDSEELRALAVSLANDFPIKQRAIRFADSLQEGVVQLPHYLNAAAMIYYNSGDLTKAEEKLRQLVSVEPTDLHAILALVSALYRQSKRQEIVALLRDTDFGKLSGSPSDKMKLAHAVADFLSEETAVALAYRTLVDAPNDPKVATGYFSLLVTENVGRVVPQPEAVELDCWVSVENELKERLSFTIEAGNGDPSHNILSPEHVIAKAALGRKVGETFLQTRPIGRQQSWTVVEILHKHAQALRNVLDHFEVRFPNSTDLLRIPTVGDDIQPILEEIRKASQAQQSVAQLYVDQHIPLAMVARRFGGSVFRVVGQVVGSGGNLVTCVGNDAERRAAVELITSHGRRGAVLDTYAAWTAASLDVLDVLEGVLGKLIVPRHVVDNIATMHDEALSGEQDGRVSIGWQDGQFVRQQFTPRDIAEHVKYVEGIQTKLQRCEVRAVSTPDVRKRINDYITTNFGAHVLDAAYLAGHEHLLLSEDLHYRALAQETVGASGLWLQIVLWYALKKGLVDLKRYTRASADLAARRHGHVNVDASMLLEAATMDAGLGLFSALADYIGVREANFPGHTAIALQLIHSVWQAAAVEPSAKRVATNVMLNKITRFQMFRVDLILAAIRIGVPNDLREHICRWIEGHFLSRGDVDAKEAELLVRRLWNEHAIVFDGHAAVSMAALASGYLSAEELRRPI